MALTLSEELLLLAYDEKTGVVYSGPGGPGILAFGTPAAYAMRFYGLPGAVVSELILAGRTRVESGRLVVADTTPTGDEWADAALNALTQAKRPPWVGRCPGLSGGTWGFADRAYRRLVGKGILRAERRRLLGFIPQGTFVLAAADEARRVKDHLREAILGRDAPDPRTAALMGLARGCGLLPQLLTKEELKASLPRVRELTQDDPVRQAVVRSRIMNDLMNCSVGLVGLPLLVTFAGSWGPIAWAGFAALLALYGVLLLLYTRAILKA